MTILLILALTCLPLLPMQVSSVRANPPAYQPALLDKYCKELDADMAKTCLNDQPPSGKVLYGLTNPLICAAYVRDNYEFNNATAVQIVLGKVITAREGAQLAAILCGAVAFVSGVITLNGVGSCAKYKTKNNTPSCPPEIGLPNAQYVFYVSLAGAVYCAYRADVLHTIATRLGAAHKRFPSAEATV